MSTPDPDPALAHFGRNGLRRFGMAGQYGVRVPGDARALLEEVGVPLHVAPYFRASGADDVLALGVFAGHRGLERPTAELADWARIGDDGLAQLCVRPDGAVQAVFLGVSEDDMFVNASLAAFNAGLAVLDRVLPVIAASSGLSDAAAAFRELSEELRGIDAAAFAERDSWWPRVLDDVRHTLNFPFSAAFEYLDEAGDKRIVTEATGPGRAHPEELIWRRLQREGISEERVRRVYCELEPCMMPGHYCAAWMQQTFPSAQFTHSFDYGADAASREAGLKELITHAAQQAGRR
ncbi:nucleic acid/nucleotide deaminase domain-containing protein [Streptomyces sp. NPDC058992]|uniref:nucleic acid/nucleotide deaminase domain-containing protein n=1 Tax=Streptomyces sp. NPDC058992 TaxID=3346688 RepID=UPI00367E023A